MSDALAERTPQRRRGAPRLRLTRVPNRYLAGQESALVNHVNGGPAIPTFTPPLPFERGVRRRPTLVGNVETLAHIALIARHGPDWFRELGIASQPGSALVTLSGSGLAAPGVYEIELGSPLPALIDAAGGLQGGCARCSSAATPAPGSTAICCAAWRSPTSTSRPTAPRSAPA